MLYGLRWGIETSFRELKHVLGAKNFHAKEREYIEMEIWARLILYNFCSIITAHVVIEQKDKERKHAYQVNYTIAYQACHYFLGLHDGQEAPNIEGLIRQNILPVRPNRNYARQHRYRVQSASLLNLMTLPVYSNIFAGYPQEFSHCPAFSPVLSPIEQVKADCSVNYPPAISLN